MQITFSFCSTLNWRTSFLCANVKKRSKRNHLPAWYFPFQIIVRLSFNRCNSDFNDPELQLFLRWIAQIFLTNSFSKFIALQKKMNPISIPKVGTRFFYSNFPFTYHLFRMVQDVFQFILNQIPCLGEQTCFLPAPIPDLKYSVSIHISLKTVFVQLQFSIGRGVHSVRYKQNFEGIQTGKPL